MSNPWAWNFHCPSLITQASIDFFLEWNAASVVRPYNVIVTWEVSPQRLHDNIVSLLYFLVRLQYLIQILQCHHLFRCHWVSHQLIIPAVPLQHRNYIDFIKNEDTFTQWRVRSTDAICSATRASYFTCSSASRPPRHHLPRHCFCIRFQDSSAWYM